MVKTILMVTDFFYPNFGGVENHVYQLSQCLLQLNYKVVVVTHAYGDCAGVRYLTNGLKVYYLYRRPLYLQSTAPTIFGSMRILRVIMLRERVCIVHAHQAFSTLGLEACLHARTMGYKVVFTDHSLFGFADVSSILMNQLLKCVLCDVHHVICVSHTSKENTVLRASLQASSVSVIPNAVNAADFLPAPADAPRPKNGLRDRVVVVALSRLVYRKGIDLMALVIPYICTMHPNVDFIIGGGGPKSALLEAMVADYSLEGRVSLRGPVPCEKAREFLLQGHIFLNASLTEAFCIAIVEAAACGLLVVSTRVGGVPEVLPPDMMELAEPSAEGLCAALHRALERVGQLKPMEQHSRVAEMYCWPDVARRTTAVYDMVAVGQCSCSRGSHRKCSDGPQDGEAHGVLQEGLEQGQAPWLGQQGTLRHASAHQHASVQQSGACQQQGAHAWPPHLQPIALQGAQQGQQWHCRQPIVHQYRQTVQQQQQQQHMCAAPPELVQLCEEGRSNMPAPVQQKDRERALQQRSRLLPPCCPPLGSGSAPGPVHSALPTALPARSSMDHDEGSTADTGGSLPVPPSPTGPPAYAACLPAQQALERAAVMAHEEKGRNPAQFNGDRELRAVHRGGQQLQEISRSGLANCQCRRCGLQTYSEAASYAEAVQGGALLARLACYRRCGRVSGLLFGALAIAVHLWWCCLQCLQPAHKVQVALDFPAASCGMLWRHNKL